MVNLYMEDEYEDDYEEYEDEYEDIDSEAEKVKEEPLASQQEEIDKLSAIINLQLSEIADGHKKNTQLYRDVAELESRISGYEKKQKELEEENIVLCDKQKKLEEELAHNRELIQSLQERERTLQENIQLETGKREECERQLYQLEHSRSWKLTKPLRIILGRLRKN